MVNSNEQALAIITDCWCHPDTEHLNPDINASARLAKKVEEVLEMLKNAHCFLGLRPNAPANYAWCNAYEQWMRENHGVPGLPCGPLAMPVPGTSPRLD